MNDVKKIQMSSVLALFGFPCVTRGETPYEERHGRVSIVCKVDHDSNDKLEEVFLHTAPFHHCKHELS